MSNFTKILKSLSFKIFLILFLSILVLFAIHAFLTERSNRSLMETEVKESAYRASDFIKKSLYTSMLQNEREDIYSSIKLLGTEPGVEVVRIYNKKGEIKYSSLEKEIGMKVDLRAEACYACHVADQPLEKLSTKEKARVYEKQSGYRVLGLINPIKNANACSSSGCHAHSPDQTILGVLDVQMSMENLDNAMVIARNRQYTMAIVIILIALILIATVIYYGIYKPTKKLRTGTKMLSSGNLDYTIDMDRNDELGKLAQSFNEMAANLKKADKELRDWSQTLEQRINDKTEELEEMHRGMVQVEKMASLGKMAATVAHELNNPLSGIVTYAKLLMRKLGRKLPDEDDEKNDMIEELDLIRSESVRCGNIVKDLLIFSRESKADFSKTSLHRAVERALNLVDHHIQLRSLHLQTDLTLEDDLVVCDEEQIVQALVALLMNAIESMQEGGQLTVSTKEITEDRISKVEILLSDTGIGIPQEIQDKIFDPFFSTKNETKGVGLGLAVVYGIVQRHQGTISVESTPGEGTAFHILLPRERKPNTDNSIPTKHEETEGVSHVR